MKMTYTLNTYLGLNGCMNGCKPIEVRAIECANDAAAKAACTRATKRDGRCHEVVNAAGKVIAVRA
jgi:hypothetical protein